MTESEKRSEYLRKKRISDLVIQVVCLIKKHEFGRIRLWLQDVKKRE